jgi:hypothetical protein
MAVCRQYQISYSHFRGGPPEWTSADRDKAIAYEYHLRSRCPRCATSEDDWKDEDGRPLEEPQWTAIVDHCTGCEEMGRVEESVSSEQRSRGFFTRWIPTDEWDPSMDQVLDDLQAMKAKAEAQPPKLILPKGLEG